MPSDIFAKLGDIKGESLDAKHKDEIEVLSFSWGVANTVAPGDRRGRRGPARRPSTTCPSCTTSTRRLPC